MNWGEIRGKIEEDAAHRIKEIHHAVSTVSSIPSTHAGAHAPVMRACVVLLWAHLEGFVKDSSRMFVCFLEGEKLILLRPSKILLPKGRPMNFGHLRNTVAFLGIDDGSLSVSIKEKELRTINRLRNEVAHGNTDDTLLDEERVRHMESTVVATIRLFKEGVFKSADDHQAK